MIYFLHAADVVLMPAIEARHGIPFDDDAAIVDCC